MGRIIIFTGKGGVGKSTTACAHALKAAKEGRKTLIVSTDMAHNLSDIFIKEIKKDPVEVMANLYALEIDSNYEMERKYDSISKAIKNLMPIADEETKGNLENIAFMPGIEQLFSLIRIKELYDEHIYDLIIVDCAPTGETLSLLKFPELLSWYMEKIFPIGKAALKVLRPISKAAFKIELPDKKAMSDIEKLYYELNELGSLLKNREVCSIRLVTIPEKMVVEETKKNYMYLNLYNFNVDGLFINRIISNDVNNKFFDRWKQIQNEYLEELNETFMDIPTYKIKWYESDINGMEYLDRVCRDSLNDKNIFEVLKTTTNEIFEKIDDGYLLKVYIPFADKKQFDLLESPTDIIIKIGNFKRNIPLPDVLRKHSVTSAKFEDKTLNIIFK